MDKQILDEYTEIFLKDHKQSYEGLFLHPEAGRDSKINESFQNINSDLKNIDNILIETGNYINALMTNSVNRLAEIKKCIISEKERYQDIQILCNRFTDFDSVKAVENISFTGNGSLKDGIFQSYPVKATKNKLRVNSIHGNGYEGNKFVYNNYEYQENIYDTSIRENMTDDKISTYYEYSRITIQNVQEETVTYFNKDSEKARCTMTFQSKDKVNLIDINTEDLGVVVSAVQYSNDGVKYESLQLPERLSINNKLDSYENYGYVYGSGFINIPPSYFFKLTFESETNKDDVIAYEKNIIKNEKQVRDNNETPKTVTSTYIVNSARRSSIKINDISAYSIKYNTKTKFVSNELISTQCYSIGLFANVYIPQSLPDNAVEFYFVINGIEYKVEPVNSHSNGAKIIRFSGGKSNTSYTHLINEKIVSAQLIIIMNNTAAATPYVNNVKILIGDEL